MDRGPWWATVHGVTKSWTLLRQKQQKVICYCNTHTQTTRTTLHWELVLIINANSNHYKENEEIHYKTFKYFKHTFHIILFSSGLATQECGILSQEVSFQGTFCSVFKCLQVAISSFTWWHHHSCYYAVPLGSHIQHPPDGKSSFSVSRNVRAGKYFLLSPGFWQNNEITISNPLLQPRL